MPDTPKLSQADFASKIREKYNAYQDIDDSTLVSKFIEKYPVYSDRVDLSSGQKAVAGDTKLKEAISKDRSKVSSFIDVMTPDYVKIGYNAFKTLGSLAKGAASGVEALATTFGEAASRTIPSAGVGAPSLSGPVSTPTKEQRKEIMGSIRTAGKQAKQAIPMSYGEKEAKFDVTDGFGFEDLKALPEIAGRVALDIPMGVSTAGASYFVQGYGDAIKDYDEQVEKTGIESDEKARQFYGVAGGTINGLLEKYAIDKIFKGPAFTKVKSRIVADVMKRASLYEGKLGIDAIETLAREETKRAMSTFKNRGIKALYGTAIEAGTEGLQTGLEETAKLASNAIQGKELFDEEEIKTNLVKNIINSAAAGGIMGGVMGGISSLTSDTNNQILEEIANAKTDEDVNLLLTNLDNIFQEERMSLDEQEIVKSQVKKYAEIKKTIPSDLSASSQDQAIRLIESRNEVDSYIKTKEEEISNMDEAVAGEEMRTLDIFKDARNSFNDRIKDVLSGEKTKYYEQDGKYFKQIGENEPEAISKNRFEFEQTYDNITPEGLVKEPTSREKFQHQMADSDKYPEGIKSLDKFLEIAPDKFFENPEWYIDVNDNASIESLNIIKNVLKNPSKKIKIYRGVPGNVNKINDGDWVSLSKEYAAREGVNVVSLEVPISDVKWDGNDINEFSYQPLNKTNATTISQEQQQELPTTSNISEYQGTESIQDQTTNEADNRNRPIGSETQQEVGVPTSAIKNKAVLFLQKQLNPFGVLGRTLTSLKEQIPGYISAEMKKGQIYIKNVQKSLAKYKDKVSTADIDAFLTGETTSTAMPEDLAKQLAQLRKHIDDMTQAMIDLKIITDPDEIELFNRGKGSYLTRAYSMFDAKGLNIDNVTTKLENVDQTVLDAALEYIADAIYNQSVQTDLFTETPKITKEEAMNQAKAMANRILADEENPFTKKKLQGSLNVKSLTERQDIAAPIRALMGEYTDPLHKYAITVFKMANLLSSQKYMTELKTVGMDKFLFKKGDPNAPKEATALLAAEGSGSMAPLAGLYTFPELKQALEQAEADKTLWITKAAGTIRAFKTVYNPMTHVKNVLGNLGFLVSNAHWSEASESFELVKELLTGKNTEKLNSLIFKLNAFGVLNNTVGIGELRAYFDKHNSLDELLDNVYNKQDGRIKKFAKSAWNKISTAPQVAYQMEDDIFKIIAYVNESNRYAKALYSKDYVNLNTQQQSDIDKKVSEIVKNTYPTFSRVPQGVKNLSKVFFLGNFLAFPVESVRVSYESLKLAYDELNSGNPVLKNIGAQRLAGTIAYNSALSGIVYYGAILAGTGLTGMAGYLFDDEEEKKKANAYRKYMAPWNKDKDAYVYQFKNGKLIYVDMGGSDPYGYQKEVWNTFWDNLGDGKGFWNSMAMSLGKAAQPFTEMDMTVKAVLNLAYNEDDYGRKIYKESDSKGKATLKTLEYLNKTISPGVVTTATRMYNAYNEDKGKFSAEVASLSGYRVYNVDLLKQFGIMLNAKNKSVVNPKQAFKDRIESDYTKSWNAVKNSDIPEAEKDIEYQRLSDGIRDILKEMREYYDAAIDGGVKESDLIDVLNRSGIKPSHRLSVMENKFDYPNSYYLRR